MSSEVFGTIELRSDVVGDAFVEFEFFARQFERHRMGDARREQRRSVEFDELFFDESPHDVAEIVFRRHGIALMSDFESIGIDELHEQREIVVVSVVRRRRHE